MFKKTFEKTREFFGEVTVETKKSSFPTRRETLGTTGVVLVLVLIVSIYLWIVDVGLAKIIGAVLP
ncbi:MAG: preprotein translocase subunit SecE [Nitrospirae bacterium]|nr:preprotein translocase subunit SecE [Nitrospirota bacterium]